jgi:hypothetical protein
VIVDWTDEFDHWLTWAEGQGGRLLATAVALLQALNELPGKPEEEWSLRLSSGSGRRGGTSCGAWRTRSTQMSPSVWRWWMRGCASNRRGRADDRGCQVHSRQ